MVCITRRAFAKSQMGIVTRVFSGPRPVPGNEVQDETSTGKGPSWHPGALAHPMTRYKVSVRGKE